MTWHYMGRKNKKDFRPLWNPDYPVSDAAVVRALPPREGGRESEIAEDDSDVQLLLADQVIDSASACDLFCTVI